MNRWLGSASIRPDSINDPAGATRDEKISLSVKNDAIGAGRAGGEGLCQSRLGRMDLARPDAHDFGERTDCDKKITLQVEGYPRGVGFNFLALNFPSRNPADHGGFGQLGIDPKNISGDSIGEIEHAISIRGDAFDDHRSVGACRIQVDENERLRTSDLHRRTGAEKQR